MGENAFYLDREIFGDEIDEKVILSGQLSDKDNLMVIEMFAEAGVAGDNKGKMGAVVEGLKDGGGAAVNNREV